MPYAATLARAFQAPITLLNVIAPPSMLSRVGRFVRGSDDTPRGDDDERTEALAGAYLKGAAAHLREEDAGDIAVTTTVRQGDPATTIAGFADPTSGALIVMASHGRVWGSVAHRVVRHATVPTMVVPGGDTDTAAHGGGIFEDVIVTLDGSAFAEQAVPVAARLAAGMRASLTLLWVVPEGSGPSLYLRNGHPFPDIAEVEREEVRAGEEYLAELARRSSLSGLDVRTVCLSTRQTRTGGGSAETIADYLNHRSRSVAVMASHGYGGAVLWALGSVTEWILANVSSPVIVVHGDPHERAAMRNKDLAAQTIPG